MNLIRSNGNPNSLVAIFTLVFAIRLTLSSSANEGTQEWSTYLNGNQRAGYVASELTSDLKPAWIYRSPAKLKKAWAGPRSAPIEGHEMRHRVDFDSSLQVALSGDRVYFGSTVDNNLYCLNSATGRPAWRFPTDGAIRLSPTLWNNHVYFGSDDGYVYCLACDNGQLVWKQRVGPRDDRLLARGEMISRWPVRTGVLIDRGIAYFGAGVFPHELVYLVAADAETGELIWKNDTISQQNAGRNDLSPQGYLLANETTLYVPSGRSLPVAVSKETGDIVFQRKYSWRTDAGGVVGGTKALLGDGQVYSGGPHHFLAMDDQTGEVGESYIGGRQMVLTEDVAYLVDGEKIFCVDRAEHARASQEKQKWFLRARDARRDPEKLAEAKDKMEQYAGVGIIWETPCPFDGALIATGSLVAVGGENEVWLLDRQSGEKVWNATVEGKVTGLAATDRLLTVSTDLGNVYGYTSETSLEKPLQWPAKPIAIFEDAKQNVFREAASSILTQSGQRTGFCLIVGNNEGRLAYELAKQSDLTIYAVESNEQLVAEARKNLEKAGLHGSRITVIQNELDAIPFSNYFANLVVSESSVVTGQPPCPANSIARFIKPCGGVAAMGSETTPLSSAAKNWTSDLVTQIQGSNVQHGNWTFYTRGSLPGSGEWTHQYGDIANTSLSKDERVRDGLGVLWYGDPGPSSMINRHEAAGAPLSTNGRMFIQGIDSVMAYDAYNGNFLWEHENPGAIRTGVFNNRETHNLAASADQLFVAIEEKCIALNAKTGAVDVEYEVPPSEDGLPRAWAYVACDSNQLFGTSTIRKELEQRLRRRGLTVETQTDAIFAYDTESGQQTWNYRGKNILHTTIAVGPERVYFIDSSITPEQRQSLYQRDKGELKKLTGDEAKKAEAEMKRLDLRLAVALDRKTGKKVWEQPVNVTDTTNVSAGGGSLTVMYADGHLVLCGANANGHYWKQFLSGQFETRKLVVLNAATGQEIWAKNANYMNRPAIVGDMIYAEPWAFHLATGEPKKRPHPVTGEESDWRFSRPGHHCGVITATPNMMFFRSGFIGYYDLYKDNGTKHFAGQRLGCWVNAIPGNGLVMIPEASAGCVCQFSIAATVVLEPKSESKSWGILSAVGDTLPVSRLAINLGAPGDFQDPARQSWFGFPRPSSRGRLEYMFDIAPEFVEGGGWVSENQESKTYSNMSKAWLYSSGALGLTHFETEVLEEDSSPEDYLVRLHFSGLSKQALEDISVSSSGRTIDTEIEMSSAASGSVQPRTATHEFVISVTDRLSIDLNYGDREADTQKLPRLCGLEIIRIATGRNEQSTESIQGASE
ncbi:MAG: PQQ-binding-like beta-propeller repeat protein [Aureliella sp.]